MLKNLWDSGLLLGSGLFLILLSPVIVLFKLLDRLQRRRMQGRPAISTQAAVVTGTLAILSILLLSYLRFLPPLLSNSQKTAILIDQGENLTSVATQLKQDGVINSTTLFKLTARLLGKDRRIQAGRYEFNTGQSMLSVLGQLSDGKASAMEVTIAPGLTARQIAKAYQDLIGVDSARFVELTQSREFIQTLDLPVENLEGFLFPETYNFRWKTPEEQILKTMLAQFKKVLFEKLQYRQSGIVKDELSDLVTLASLIQKEGQATEEFPLIAAVFRNRLKIDMPLQCDPSILYVLPPLKRSVRPKDLEIDSPYNTYKYYGLPPGPICNPGQEALKAALHPADVKYLYFVHRGDGTHIFSKTLEEHNRAVWRLRKNNSS
jgi:UPF0755 protein